MRGEVVTTPAEHAVSQTSIDVNIARTCLEKAQEDLARFNKAIADGPPAWIRADRISFSVWHAAHNDTTRARIVYRIARCEAEVAKREGRLARLQMGRVA